MLFFSGARCDGPSFATSQVYCHSGAYFVWQR